MKIKHLYLILCILGLILPCSKLIPFLSAFFAWDVIILAIVLLIFIIHETRKSGIKRFWLPIVAIFTFGVSLGLPLLLYQSDLVIERN